MTRQEMAGTLEKHYQAHPELRQPTGEGDLFLVSTDVAQQFYKSAEWRALRKEVVAGSDLRCCACHLDLHKLKGAAKTLIHVDHIKPVRACWEQRLERSNLQILCADCNRNKGSSIAADANEIAARTTRVARASLARTHGFLQRSCDPVLAAEAKEQRIAALIAENEALWMTDCTQSGDDAHEFIRNRAIQAYVRESFEIVQASMRGRRL